MDADPAVPHNRLLTLRLLTPALALLYLGAAILHTGVRVPLGFATLGFPEPVTAATIAESLIGTGLVAAALMLVFAPVRTRLVVVGIYALAIFFTILPLSGLVGPQTLEDRVVHAVMLVGVVIGLGLLLLARKSRFANNRRAMSSR